MFAPVLATLAVSVRGWPTVEGFTPVVKDVAVAAGCTAMVTALEVAGELLPSPA